MVAADLYIRPEIFREAFAADLPARTARLMQMTQRPLSAAALGEPSGTAGLEDDPLLVPAGDPGQDDPARDPGVHGSACRVHGR